MPSPYYMAYSPTSVVFGNTKPVSSPNLRAIINYFQEYAKENGYKTAMEGDKPSDEWISKYKAKKAAQRQNDAAEAATNGPSSNPVVQQPEDDFWASLKGGASCVTIEGADAIGSPSIQQLADQLKANMAPTVMPKTMEPSATPEQKVPFEPQPAQSLGQSPCQQTWRGDSNQSYHHQLQNSKSARLLRHL